MSAVAAKSRVMHPMPSCVVKRNVRLRQRAALGALRIPNQISEGPGLKRDSTFSPQSDQMVYSASIAPIHFMPGPDTLGALEIDTDTETSVSTETGTESDETASSVTQTSAKLCCFTDLSNLLGRPQSKDNGGTLRQLDSRTLSRENSCDTDSYGWESEFDRKLDCGSADPTRGCSALGLH
ncbi:hypothetical protein F4808DRAFT_244746 [Astrocystis sublimbata]|nr:hypothetical protein F4808DRAFT_244746 [Astrocystis sublimbata]